MERLLDVRVAKAGGGDRSLLAEPREAGADSGNRIVGVGLTTAPRAESTIGRTLDSLAMAGFARPTIFAEPGSLVPEGFEVVWNKRKFGAWPNFQRALGHVSNMTSAKGRKDFVLMLQDDIEVCAGLARYIERADLPSGGIISLYTAAEIAKKHCDLPDGFHGWFGLPESAIPDKCYGALALLIPVRIARRLEEEAPSKANERLVDYFAGLWCKQNGVRWFHHRPGFVEHIGRHSAIRATVCMGPARTAREWITSIDENGRFHTD